MASRAERLAEKSLGMGIFMEGVDACSISPPIVSSAASDLALDDCVGVGIPEGYCGSLTTSRALARLVLPPPMRVRALLKVVTEPLLTVRWCVETCIALFALYSIGLEDSFTMSMHSKLHFSRTNEKYQ